MSSENCKTEMIFKEIMYGGAKAGEVTAQNSSDLEFAADLAYEILETLEPIADESCFIVLSGYRDTNMNNLGYKIKVTRSDTRDYDEEIASLVSKPDEFMQLFLTELNQDHTVGNDTCVIDHSESIVIQVVMFANEDQLTKAHLAKKNDDGGNSEAGADHDDSEPSDQKCHFVPNCWAKPLIYITLGTYYRVFSDHYPNVPVCYTNTPVADSFKIDRVGE